LSYFGYYSFVGLVQKIDYSIILLYSTDMDWTINKEKTYWNDKEWFQKRNEELVADKKAGMSIAKLIAKYNVTPNVIYKVVENYERKMNELQ
jgi:hypothetical protein